MDNPQYKQTQLSNFIIQSNNQKIKKKTSTKKKSKSKISKVNETISFSDMELDCISEIKTFIKGGEYAMQLLKRVLPNIWKHFQVTSYKKQDEILDACQFRLHDILLSNSQS